MATLYDMRCLSPATAGERFRDDGLQTYTSEEQVMTEDLIGKIYQKLDDKLKSDPEAREPMLKKDEHMMFLLNGIRHLHSGFTCLDASRPWLCYWILHSLELLDTFLPNEFANNVANFIGKCQRPTGGFGGGPLQDAHLAPTYAAVCALSILGTEEALSVIDRESLQKFLISMKLPDGSFRMHEGGEIDIRGAYCAIVAARLTNVAVPEMFQDTADWIVSCQTYEGGFAGCPGSEAHGGYSFCGLAALILLGKEKLCDLDRLLRWTVNRQMRFEGGFQGRTNKLVDGCYSFWQGGVFPLLHLALAVEDDHNISTDKWMFHQEALQEYILTCCQAPHGGLVDKPGKARDFYHSCYCLSGLSVAQHFIEGKLENTNLCNNLVENKVEQRTTIQVGMRLRKLHTRTVIKDDASKNTITERLSSRLYAQQTIPRKNAVIKSASFSTAM